QPAPDSASPMQGAKTIIMSDGMLLESPPSALIQADSPWISSPQWAHWQTGTGRTEPIVGAVTPKMRWNASPNSMQAAHPMTLYQRYEMFRVKKSTKT